MVGVGAGVVGRPHPSGSSLGVEHDGVMVIGATQYDFGDLHAHRVRRPGLMPRPTGPEAGPGGLSMAADGRAGQAGRQSHGVIIGSPHPSDTSVGSTRRSVLPSRSPTRMGLATEAHWAKGPEAIAERDGATADLPAVEHIPGLDSHPWWHASRVERLQRLGRDIEAAHARDDAICTELPAPHLHNLDESLARPPRRR